MTEYAFKNGVFRAKGGRPALPPEDRRSEAIRIWLTPDQADSVHRAAIRRGWTTAEYVRVALGFPAPETEDWRN